MIKSNDLRVDEYFQSRGMQPLDISSLGLEKDNLKPDIAFTDSNNRIFVKIIDSGPLNERSALLDAVMKSVDFLKEANAAYLLLPKLYASIIDGKLFYNHGVGLLTYDKRGAIQEIIKPKIFSQINKENLVKMPEETLIEINNLNKRIRSLEQDFSKLKEELDELRVKKVNIETNEDGPKSYSLNAEIHDDAPEFMKDNPWIGILSKRGKD
ncbi:hypothetical protein AC481_00985 [miscellaneous Crenarchaeota group archaeon SMTZ-80]|nr:MAG: hypothetical protein AC481_00985 [miscellaneous Crenarchaeota group archaeon SMTZ-80]